jgi:hypothetical protein
LQGFCPVRLLKMQLREGRVGIKCDTRAQMRFVGQWHFRAVRRCSA